MLVFMELLLTRPGMEYNRVWLAYVTEVRQKQLQHFEDEHQRVLAELEKSRQTFLDPEVPPQLRRSRPPLV